MSGGRELNQGRITVVPDNKDANNAVGWIRICITALSIKALPIFTEEIKRQQSIHSSSWLHVCGSLLSVGNLADQIAGGYHLGLQSPEKERKKTGGVSTLVHCWSEEQF